MRLVYLGLGWLFVALGIIGAFLPLLPTTPFLLLAIACFTRSSPRLEAWLLDHPRFGPPLRAWREKRAIPRRAKVMAVGLMAASYAFFLVSASPSAWLAALVLAILAASSLFIVTRPDAG